MIDRDALAEFDEALPGRAASNSCSLASRKKVNAFSTPTAAGSASASARFRNSAIHASDGNTSAASSGLLSLDHLPTAPRDTSTRTHGFRRPRIHHFRLAGAPSGISPTGTP